MRSAIDPGWSQLWDAGRLGITCEDDFEDVIRKFIAYLRKHHNPLLDRQRFHARNQEASESVDQYFAALTRIYNAGDYQDTHNCDLCGQQCTPWYNGP